MTSPPDRPDVSLIVNYAGRPSLSIGEIPNPETTAAYHKPQFFMTSAANLEISFNLRFLKVRNF